MMPTSVVQRTGASVIWVTWLSRSLGTRRNHTFTPGKVGNASVYHRGSSVNNASPFTKFETLVPNDQCGVGEQITQNWTEKPEELPSNRSRTRYPACMSPTVTRIVAPEAPAFLYPKPWLI